jgi:hypothetical protein
MIPNVKLDTSDQMVPSAPATDRASERMWETSRALTYSERQGLMMSWVGIALGMFLLLGGLALWASAALGAGFIGWLVSLAVMGAVIVATIVAVSVFVIRPRG